MKIQVLPPDLANKIAAGEVVERPASVVKELIENSIDAKAAHITISIRGSGLEGIQVTDNGAGIDKTDLPLALASHATSKIKTADDLMCIESLGFRGEALASIAAVSHFSLQSCTQESDSGFEINNETKTPAIKPAAHPQGTTVIVNDLFYNVPARRKFLKSAKTEFSHIEEVIRRQALSTFNVAFNLLHNKREVLRLAPAYTRAEREKRVSILLGQGFIKNCLYVETARNGLTLQGWVANAEIARTQNDRQYCFLNGRVIRDKLLHHAIRQAYEDRLPAGRYPSVVLFLSCDPAAVDVNVHPTKHEVRFHDARLVHDFLFRSVKDILQHETKSDLESVENASVDRYQQDILVSNYRLKQSLEPKSQGYETKSAWQAVKSITQYRLIGVFASRYILTEEKNIPKAFQVETRREYSRAAECISQHMSSEASSQQSLNLKGEGYSLIFIDAKRVHAKWITRRLLKDSIRTQPLLVPLRYTVNTAVMEKWETCEMSLSKLGVTASLLGSHLILIRQIPSLLRDVTLEPVLSQCFELMVQNYEQTVHEKLIAIMAEAAATHLCNNRFDSAIAQQVLSEYEEISEESPVKQYEWQLSDKDIAAAFSGKK